MLAVATMLTAVLPPAHIHLGKDDHDHSIAIEHSHWSSHGGASRTSIDDDDGQAIFVDHPGVLTAARSGMELPTRFVATILSIVEPPVFAHRADRLAGNAPRDGPHLDISPLRGPPFVL